MRGQNERVAVADYYFVSATTADTLRAVTVPVVVAVRRRCFRQGNVQIQRSKRSGTIDTGTDTTTTPTRMVRRVCVLKVL